MQEGWGNTYCNPRIHHNPTATVGGRGIGDLDATNLDQTEVDKFRPPWAPRHCTWSTYNSPMILGAWRTNKTMLEPRFKKTASLLLQGSDRNSSFCTCGNENQSQLTATNLAQHSSCSNWKFVLFAQWTLGGPNFFFLSPQASLIPLLRITFAFPHSIPAKTVKDPPLVIGHLHPQEKTQVVNRPQNIPEVALAMDTLTHTFKAYFPAMF